MNRNRNELKRGGSYEKDPKQMTMEELDMYLENRVEEFQNREKQAFNDYQNDLKINMGMKKNASDFKMGNLNKNIYMKKIQKTSMFNTLQKQITSLSVNNQIDKLQDKIKDLVKENYALKENFATISQMFNIEKNNEGNYDYDRNIYSTYIEEHENLVNENKRINEENFELKNQLKKSKEKIDLLESEKKRCIEMGLQEKVVSENVILDLKSQIQTLQSQLVVLQNRIDIYEEEKKKKAEEEKNKKSKDRNNFPRSKLYNSKKSINLPNSTKNTGSQSKNSKNKRINASLSQYSPNNANKLNNYMNIGNYTLYNQDNFNLQRMKSYDRLFTDRNDYFFTNSQRSLKTQIELSSINSQITAVESNIEQLKINYKDLSQKMQLNNEQNEQNKIQENLQLISKNLEEKTVILLNLRKHQQDLLKTSLYEINSVNN